MSRSYVKLVERHVRLSGSRRAQWILDNWNDAASRFIKSFPHEFKRVMGIPRKAASLRSEPIRSIGRSRAGAAWVRQLASWIIRGSLRREDQLPERVNDWFEIYQDFPEEKLRKQGARCMDCGVPFARRDVR